LQFLKQSNLLVVHSNVSHLIIAVCLGQHDVRLTVGAIARDAGTAPYTPDDDDDDATKLISGVIDRRRRITTHAIATASTINTTNATAPPTIPPIT
jgi:hypothetical protein